MLTPRFSCSVFNLGDSKHSFWSILTLSLKLWLSLPSLSTRRRSIFHSPQLNPVPGLHPVFLLKKQTLVEWGQRGWKWLREKATPLNHLFHTSMFAFCCSGSCKHNEGGFFKHFFNWSHLWAAVRLPHVQMFWIVFHAPTLQFSVSH